MRTDWGGAMTRMMAMYLTARSSVFCQQPARCRRRRRYRALFRTYGPRSFLYAEMVFGNTLNVSRLTAGMPQSLIFAMRAERNIPLTEVTARTGLSVDEVKRFNPALVRQVPARANLYLPRYIPEFGADVSFWHRPASPAYAAVLNKFVRLHARRSAHMARRLT